MRRMLLALVSIVGISTAAHAGGGWGSPPVPQSQPSSNMYGWNPAIKNCLFWWKKDSCNSGCNGKGCNTGAPGAGGQPQGTLVFPQHPYVRSPRDFFMWGN